jgi:hypothetical protein
MSLDVYLERPGMIRLFDHNITHNLTDMAKLAGLYEALWRPEEIGITYAHQLIGPLEAGLLRLKSNPGKFTPLNPSNGWGSYDGLVKFVESYLEACRENPDATVRVSR